MIILTVDYKRLPRLFCFSLGALCSLVIATLVFEHRVAGLSDQQNEDYGAALARTAARQAVDATLNHDLVSLQVILQDVATNPRVLLATIHDVENNLLVQAGDATLARVTELPLSAHTAPITLHDSVAGYVTVTVSGANIHRGLILTAVTAIALLLAAIAGLSLYDKRDQVFVRRAPPENSAGPESVSESVDEEAANSPTDERRCVRARLQVVNLEELRQQLTASLFQTAAEKLRQLLDDVLALYNGRIEQASDQGLYVLIFDSHEGEADAAFRAACSVYLAARLAVRRSPMPITLGAHIALEQDSRVCAEEVLRDAILLDEDVARHHLLQQRLVLVPTDCEYQQLQEFHQPFAALLERQYQQLVQILP